MTDYTLQEEDWAILLEEIRRGTCVLMLGSDIPADTENSGQDSLSRLLARHLADKVSATNPAAKLCDRNDLPHVAQTYFDHQVGRRNRLESEVNAFYKTYQQHTTPLHLSLAQLPFSHCISITPDDLMHNAYLQQADKSPHLDFYDFSGGNKPLQATPTAANPLLYKLYGATSDMRSVVLAETDLLDFLANIIAGQPELPPLLAKLLSDKATSFLFIGFGFQRWYLRILLHVFRKQLKPPLSSYALEDHGFFNNAENEQTVLYYGHAHALEFKHCPWQEFAENLLSRYQSLPSNPSKPATPPPDAPRIFLCHSGKNSAAVAQFGEKLRQRGLNTWRDKDNLRGGERWDGMIKHVIENQIDYFLILQTPDMLAPAASYFVKEIHCALERQKHHWEKFLFIIPAFFAGTTNQTLDALDPNHYLDLRTDSGLDRLVQNIHDDQQQRQARQEQAYAD